MIHPIRIAALVVIWGMAGMSVAQAGDRFQPGIPEINTLNQTQKPKPAAKKKPEEVIPPPGPGALFPAVVARVNGSPVLGRDLEQRIQAELVQLGNPAWENLRPDYHRELIGRHMTSLVGTELLYQQAKSDAVQVTEEEIQAEFEQVAKTFPDDAAFNTVLAERGMDRQGLRKELEKSLVAAKYVRENVAQKIVVTPAEVSEYYKTHTEEFRHGDMVRTSHILIRPPDNASEAQINAAKERAETVLKRAEAGEDFAQLAKEFSMDPSASQGGDIGFAEKGQLDPAYEKTAFALKPGATSGLVQSSFGFHIIKVTEKRMAGLATLPDIRDQLTDFLKTQKSDDELDKLVRQLREKADLVFLIPLNDIE